MVVLLALVTYLLSLTVASLWTYDDPGFFWRVREPRTRPPSFVIRPPVHPPLGGGGGVETLDMKEMAFVVRFGGGKPVRDSANMNGQKTSPGVPGYF